MATKIRICAECGSKWNRRSVETGKWYCCRCGSKQVKQVVVKEEKNKVVQ